MYVLAKGFRGQAASQLKRVDLLWTSTGQSREQKQKFWLDCSSDRNDSISTEALQSHLEEFCHNSLKLQASVELKPQLFSTAELRVQPC